MLAINMDDVMKVINTMKPHLIALGIIIVVAVLLMILAGKISQENKRQIRGTSFIAMILGIMVVVNMICTGPMSTMLDLVSGKGTITEDTSEEARQAGIDIAKEGMALLQNNDKLLPYGEGTSLNVFGWASTNPCYGGTGSGSMSDAYETTSLLQSLADAGIKTNESLTKFYTDYKDARPEVGMWAQDWTLPEPNVDTYTDDLMKEAKDFSDQALIVITRVGGEGADLPTDMPAVVAGTFNKKPGSTYFAGTYDDELNQGNDWDEGDTYLDLTNREEEMIKLVCDNFDDVVLVYNGANTMNLSFIEDYKQIKSVLWTAGAGQAGFEALGQILTGQVNPSAKTVDTWVRDFKKTPWWNNFGDFTYTNMDDFKYTSTGFTGQESTSIPTFVNYVEGIYVGYKFYETAAAENAIKYEDYVQFPFGYGLSYTTFDQKMGPIKEEDGNLTFDVTVTNTGDVEGKDVVQVYFNPPYTQGGIEKSTANLVEFAKTGSIAPGQSETVTISFSKEDLAAYDYLKTKAYVLEKGKYQISINQDSHTVLDSKTYKVGKTIKYTGDNKRSSDLTTATNLFDQANGGLTYLSRKDKFANLKKATAAPKSFEMADDQKKTFYNISNYLTDEATAADEDPKAEAIVTGAKNGLKLADMRGLDKDDPKWDQLMDEMTLEDMNGLISLGGYQTAAVESIGKVRTNDCDGPASINNNFTGTGSIGFPAATLIAATWNKDLAHTFGDCIGKMANEMDVSGWYAPAMNIHRTAFAGRNFEYYSEDGVISGYMASEAVKGAADHQVYAYIKHFALNDQEGNRCDMLCTWTNEQALREVYLRPFEIAVKDGGAQAVMSSFNYVGNRWAGGLKELQTDVLRGEWGFNGFVLTDYFGVYGYMSSDQAIRNGTDAMLVNYPTQTNNVQFQKTNGAQQAMRTSAKNILYVVVNSRAYDEANLDTGMATWRIIMYVADVAIVLLMALLCFRIFKRRG